MCAQSQALSRTSVNLALTLIGPPWVGRHPDKGIIMRAEMLTAVLALVNPMSLTRRHRNNGNAIVAIDLAEHPDDPLGVAGTLNARIERLEALPSSKPPLPFTGRTSSVSAKGASGSWPRCSRQRRN